MLSMLGPLKLGGEPFLPGRGRRLTEGTRTYRNTKGSLFSQCLSLALITSYTLQALMLTGTALPVEMRRTRTVLCHTYSAEKATSRVICRHKLSTSTASSHQNKLLLASLRLLQQFAGYRRNEKGAGVFCGLVGPAVPNALHPACLLSSFDDILLFTVRLQGFTWLTCGSSKSPERQQNSAQNEKLQNKGSYCALYEPVFTADAIFTSASITSSHLMRIGQESLNESPFCP